MAIKTSFDMDFEILNTSARKNHHQNESFMAVVLTIHGFKW